MSERCTPPSQSEDEWQFLDQEALPSQGELRMAYLAACDCVRSYNWLLNKVFLYWGRNRDAELVEQELLKMRDDIDGVGAELVSLRRAVRQYSPGAAEDFILRANAWRREPLEYAGIKAASAHLVAYKLVDWCVLLCKNMRWSELYGPSEAEPGFEVECCRRWLQMMYGEPRVDADDLLSRIQLEHASAVSLVAELGDEVGIGSESPSRSTEPNHLISQEQASELVDCSPKTIMRRIQDGTLQAYGAEGKRKVSKSEVIQKRDQILTRKPRKRGRTHQ